MIQRLRGCSWPGPWRRRRRSGKARQAIEKGFAEGQPHITIRGQVQTMKRFFWPAGLWPLRGGDRACFISPDRRQFVSSLWLTSLHY